LQISLEDEYSTVDYSPTKNTVSSGRRETLDHCEQWKVGDTGSLDTDAPGLERDRDAGWTHRVGLEQGYGCSMQSPDSACGLRVDCCVLEKEQWSLITKEKEQGSAEHETESAS
ncbi:hypothetical protein JZ751_021828, partial [Albula glossodonta]